MAVRSSDESSTKGAKATSIYTQEEWKMEWNGFALPVRSATKTNQQDPFWVDPGVPTLPEAEQLIASLMLASRPDWPISACVGCHVSPPPFYKKKLAGHHFNFRYFNSQQENSKQQKNS
ncbi:hypothetical protein ACLKA6_010476 [Drosophila palustris]